MYLSAHQATKKLGISIFPELTSQYVDNNAAAATTITKKGLLYTQVSSAKKKEDFKRQKQLLSTRFPTYELISDINSGVNFKQPGLKTLLEWTSRRMVSKIVVTYNDRLCQFTFNLIQYVLSLHTTKLMVLFDDTISD
jgi:predicted site-specific integrase-resolvase